MKRLMIIFCCCISILQMGITQNHFPNDWFGKWRGTLEIFTAKGNMQTLTMELEISPTDSVGLYHWVIGYITDSTTDQRRYLLRTLDATKGYYQIDEQNSIIMEGYWLANKFYQQFSVMGNTLFCIDELRDGILHMEIIVSREEPISTTGNTTQSEEEIPIVKAFPIKSVQKAALKRQ